MTTLKKVYNLREEGDDTCASVYVHKNGDIPNSQCVRVELIEVSDDYFSLDENLNLPSEVRSDAYFRPMDKATDGKKATGGGKKVAGKGNKATDGGKKHASRGKRVEQIFLNVNGSFLVSPSLPKNDIKDGYASE